MSRQTFLLLLSFVFTGGLFPVKGSPLFENGKSNWKIYIPSASGKTEEYASVELRDAIRKISGAVLPVIKSDDIPNEETVIIGATDAPAVRKVLKELNLAKKEGLGEAVAMKEIGGNLYLVGNNSRAALFAVYHFLQKELGVRWLWAGESGEFMPKRAVYSVPSGLAFSYKPKLVLRELNPCGLGRLEEHEIFLIRNFNNAASKTPSVVEKTGSIMMQRNHWVYPDEKLFQEKPEIFAQYKGKRIAFGQGGCWTNPEFQRLMVEKLVKIAKKNRLDIMNAYPADSTVRCSCGKCTENPNESSRWFDFYAILIDGVRKELPDLKFAGIAYQEYRVPPVNPVRNLEYVEYCQYDRCYVHRLSNPECSLNKGSLEMLKKWRSRAPMGIYGYEFDVFTGKSAAIIPFWNLLADEARYFAANDIRHVMTEAWIESPKSKDRKDLFQQKQRINYYIYSQMLWNPDADPDALLSDFCRTVYGPAAKEMEDYFKAFASSWEKMSVHLTYFHNDSTGIAKHLITSALVETAHAKFAAASRVFAGMKDSAVRKRIEEEIAIDRSHFEQWEKARNISLGRNVSCSIPLGKGAEDAISFSFKTDKGETAGTVLRIYCTKDALHLLFDCPAGEDVLQKGIPGRDHDLFMEECIEIFLDLDDGESYRHFAINPAGGYYDALGMNKSWNPEWRRTVRIKEDGKSWAAEVILPFASLGGIPKAGSSWRLVADRSMKTGRSGFPAPAFHDLSAGALLYFSGEPFPDRRMTWFVKDKESVDQYLEPLYKRGWNYRIVRHADHASADTSGTPLIVWSTHENKLEQNFFEKQILERVRNGAVLICHQYGPCQYEKYFKDPSFTVGWSSGCDPLRKTTYVVASSFADYPDNLRKMLVFTPPLVLLPAEPEKWDVLARQKDSKGKEQPYILARPYGKGLVIINASMRNTDEMIARFNNAMEYNKRIRR